mmetsp:Transcript_47634/g.126316  ORF Transcript_47634/g.126316 Transcript_47634/m.126316 type:complete len:203 (-) Transcript_47634:60-668(-)
MPGKPGLNGKLVDSEGFPRADVDVHQVRQLRHRHICLQTDHQQVMKQLEQAMFAHFAALKSEKPESITSQAAPRSDAAGPPLTSSSMEVDRGSWGVAAAVAAPSAPPVVHPFAVADEVFEGSPAAAAGVEVGDRVLALGRLDLDAIRREGFAALAGEVAAHEGRGMRLLVIRGGEACPRELTLTPRAWPGRGLLGCHLRPVG